MKRIWLEPRAVVHAFTANEDISARWNVGCGVGGTGNYGGYDWNNMQPTDERDNGDHSGPCSRAKKTYFNVAANGMVSFYAENNDQHGFLNGTYTGFDNKNDNGVVDAGDVAFWYTNSAEGQKRWCHWGTAVNADSRHPNRS